MRFSTVVGLLGAASAVSAIPFVSRKTNSLSTTSQDLFDFSMAIQDSRWDDSYKYQWYLDNGPWSIRFTAWYVVGLLARNKNNDVANAEAAIKNILGVQMNYNYSSAWYGDYKLSPDEPNPTPDSDLYPPEVYGTYDPNWREFVGTALVQAVAGYEHLLDKNLVKEVETALATAAVGEMRRNGSYPEGDNLILGYSNPEYMRLWTVSWIGYRLNNQTFIDFADTKADQLLALFKANGSNTLTEYNVPTYYGMDIYALAGIMKYAPTQSRAYKNVPYILTELMKDIADHFNPYLGNMAGPYDRAYARDMPTHSAVTALWLWSLFGYDKAPVPYKGNDDLHYDVTQGAAIALLSDTVKSVLSQDTIKKLTVPFKDNETRFLNKTIREDLSTDVLRVATSWLSKNVMIGGEQLAEDTNRGSQFTPAIVHWASDPKHTPYPYGGWFSLYPTASTITAVATANKLSISYPNATQDGSDMFTYMISGIPPTWTLAGNYIDGFSNLPCLKVTVSGAEEFEQLETNYYGNTISNQYFYNVTYVVPANYSGVPTMDFDIEYTC